MYYKLDADHNVVAAARDEWIALIGSRVRIIQQEHVTPQVWVSTVFLGLDHGYDDNAPPVVFETMAFIDGSGEDQQRYCTYAEAVAGHAAMVAKYKP